MHKIPEMYRNVYDELLNNARGQIMHKIGLWLWVQISATKIQVI